MNSFTVSNAQESRKGILQSNLLVDLSNLGIIKVSGKDAWKFLQSQFTNDVHQVTATQSQLSAWCNAKGRMLVSFRVFKREEKGGTTGKEGGSAEQQGAFYLLMPQINVETTLKRLQIYVLRSQVRLEEVSKKIPRLGVAGEQSADLLATCLGWAPPLEINASVTDNGVTVLCLPGTTGRYVVLTEDPQRLQEMSKCLAKRMRSVGPWAWEVLDILAGIPHLSPMLADIFVPQMLNYQALGGVSLKKGCYPGQEVVARMQYLGVMKRRMYLIKIHSATPPLPGHPLYVHGEEPGIGQIINAQAHPEEENCVIALAVISISHVENGEKIYVEGHPRDRLELLELPYEVKNEK